MTRLTFDICVFQSLSMLNAEYLGDLVQVKFMADVYFRLGVYVAWIFKHNFTINQRYSSTSRVVFDQLYANSIR